jgi:hypothetical protein
LTLVIDVARVEKSPAVRHDKRGESFSYTVYPGICL